MIRVRACLLALLAAGLSPAAAQQPGRTYALAFLSVNPNAGEMLRAFVLPELTRAGFVEGRNLTVETIVATANTAQSSVARLMQRPPDAILAVGGLTIEAARQAAPRVPVVALGASGAAGATPDNLARPADNVTGTVILGPELEGKRLEFLNELAPGSAPIATMLQGSNPYVESRYKVLASVASTFGIDLKHVKLSDGGSYQDAFNAIRAHGPRALLVGSDPQHFRDIPEISRRAQEARLPTICHWREMTEAGCLASYGPSLPALYRRSGEQLARILKGTRVADIPIEAPAVFELVVNLKVARQLGLTVSPALIARADEVIE